MPLFYCNIKLYVMLILKTSIHAGSGTDKGYHLLPDLSAETTLRIDVWS